MRPPFPKSMFSAFQCLTLWFFNRILMLPIETYLKTKQNIRQKVLMLSFVWVPYHKPSSYTSKSDFFFFLLTLLFLCTCDMRSKYITYMKKKSLTDVMFVVASFIIHWSYLGKKGSQGAEAELCEPEAGHSETCLKWRRNGYLVAAFVFDRVLLCSPGWS